MKTLNNLLKATHLRFQIKQSDSLGLEPSPHGASFTTWWENNSNGNIPITAINCSMEFKEELPCAEWWSVLAYTDGGLRTLIVDHLQFMEEGVQGAHTEDNNFLKSRQDSTLA